MFEKDATEYAIIGWDKSSDPRDVFTPRIDETKFNDWRNGAEFGYNKANEEHKGKCKTAYIRGIRTMANALKDYDRTNGAWTDYFEHTVEEVLNRLLKEIE